MFRITFILAAAMALTAMIAVFLATGAYADDMSDMADWCTRASAPSSIVICSDPELRRMTVVRNKIFVDARSHFDPEDMKELNDDQNSWIHEYTADCGAAVNGPPVSLPVRQDIIDCFKQASRERIAELVRNVRDVIPGYQAPPVTGNGGSYDAPTPPAFSSDQDERQKAAENRRRALEERAKHEELAKKLAELGFKLLAPVDLDLDWKTFIANNTKIAVSGTYLEAHDVEGAIHPG